MFSHPEPKFWLSPWCQISFAPPPLDTNPGCVPDSTVSLVKTTVFSEKLSQNLSAILLNCIPESSFPNLLSNDVVIPFPLFSLEKVYLAKFLTYQNYFLLLSDLRKLLSQLGKRLSQLGKSFWQVTFRIAKVILFLESNLRKQLSEKTFHV